MSDPTMKMFLAPFDDSMPAPVDDDLGGIFAGAWQDRSGVKLSSTDKELLVIYFDRAVDQGRALGRIEYMKDQCDVLGVTHD